MKLKLTYLITLVLFINGLVVQAKQSANNLTDANNLQQGFWVYTNKTKKLPGYGEDQVVEQGYYKDSRKIGKWVTYYPNGKVQHELTYENNRPDGHATFYYENGKIKEEGIWRNNRWVGAYKFYYENGKVRNEWQYSETGKRTGVQRYYHENGQLMIEGAWENGKESGKLVEYYEDGSVKFEKFYADGTLDPASVKSYSKAEKKGEGTNAPAVNKPATPAPKPAPVAAKPVVKKSVVDSLAADENARVIIKKEDATADQKPFDGNGYYELRNKDGQIIRKGVFQNGYLLDGQMFQYSPTGKAIKTTHYKGGKVIKVENL
jgi:antitoxin component YwqK of YwqJK toxin-antitoxin module